ncbi:MAG: bifunctional 4-hydroxy-3-methylbut-2-enyl diphosphate reductase/30S ribosomal protein S1 [Eubacteriales bacterium]|nr:bifunctional 4-hydroxy-3-methylbut-2-enyl diphosphate reductase/30S ribosomal protein S1 [Eubacteriales bacterium]
MPLIVSRRAGYCYGVRRAMEMAEQAAREYGGCYTLGSIIHNPHAVASLAAKGAHSVQKIAQLPAGSVCVIRSHGEPPETYRALEAGGVRIIDATCPSVSRIHRMVEQAAAQGRRVIVVGKASHPEVQGILGWAQGKGEAVLSEEEALALSPSDEALVVCQTTLSTQRYQRVCSAIAKRVERPDIRKTNCQATILHREEAAEIARKADAMIVVGGSESSNTKELWELCLEYCPRSVRVDRAEQIDPSGYRPGDLIGITAGASTPEGTFKEVVARMNDIENKEQIIENTEAESDFMADVEKTLRQIRPGQVIMGTVVQITEDEVCVNVGYKADGLVKKSDLSSTDVKVGDEIEVEVVKVNDGEGNVLCSQRNIVNRKAWDAIVAASEADEFVEGIGKESVKGGLIAQIEGIRAFIPASQLSLRYVEKIDEFVGQPMKLKIIELDKTKKRVVASRKAVLAIEEAEKKKAIWGTLEIGSVVKGIVRRLTDFGAFVDIGGVDGLVHVTDLSWGRVHHPSDVVTVGQEIDVKIKNVDTDRERISLSYKETQPRPWDVAGEKYAVGTVVEGKVVRITTFGAFVELEPGLDGLVHISQCALTRIEKVEDALHVGDVIRVKILDVNTESRRISLSVREVLEDEALETVPESDDEYAIDDVPAVEE